MKQVWQMMTLGSVLVAGICSGSSAKQGHEKLSLDDSLHVTVFRYQMHRIDAPWVCLSLGGTWAEGHGRNIVIHHGPTRTPTSAVVRLSLRQRPSAIHGVPVRLVGSGPDLGPYGSERLSVAALRWVDSSHAVAYGSVRGFPPKGSENEGGVDFYIYELNRNASGWKVASAKSVMGFG